MPASTAPTLLRMCRPSVVRGVSLGIRDLLWRSWAVVRPIIDAFLEKSKPSAGSRHPFLNKAKGILRKGRREGENGMLPEPGDRLERLSGFGE